MPLTADDKAPWELDTWLGVDNRLENDDPPLEDDKPID